jgi:uncharacterized protein (TIGR00730 family)
VKRICVFCGSNSGFRPEYGAAASRLGCLLARRAIGLVYGGANRGLMTTLADAVLAGGGEVTGVMPRGLVAREVAHTGLSDLRVVNSMHERKALMADLSDAFIAMPGGYGTFDELFEALSWSQLGIQRKACGLLNVRGFFDPLLGMLDHAVSEGFLRREHRALLISASEPEALLAALAAAVMPEVEKWVDGGVR